MSVIELKNVDFSYEKEGAPVLLDLSLNVEEGEFLAVVGKNGSGKSTLSRIINGILTPKAGSVTVLGMDALEEKNLFEIRKSVGIVFQNPDNQMVASIVEDDVAFGPENIGVERKEIGERIEFSLKATNTESFRQSMASRLSGGQKQRVAIAGVLAIKPKILILDESTSMLDPRGRDEVMAVVRRLNKEEKMTVLTITHYMDEVVDADRVAVMGEGRILKIDTPENIFADPTLLSIASLEPPISVKISSALKKGGLDLGYSLKNEDLKDKLVEAFKK